MQTKHLVPFGLGLLIPGAALIAEAGYVLHPEVSIHAPGGAFYTQRVQGSLVGARNSSDNLQYIGCRVDEDDTGYCFGRDASGTSKSCVISQPKTAELARSIDSESYVKFEWLSGFAECSYLEVRHLSYYKD